MISGIELVNKIHSNIFETEPKILENVIKKTGRYDGKYSSNISLASHIINTALIGVNTYAYDKFVLNDEEYDEEEFKILLSALVLHDANKYVNEKYEWNKDKNDREVLEKYFEEDDFEVNKFLDGDHFDDLLYLIQRSEVKEDSRETRGIKTEFRHLDRYCRIGDGTASKILDEGVQGGKKYLEKKYLSSEGKDVHLLEFVSVEQPILNDLLISSVKSYIAGKNGSPKGIVLGSTNEAILYLGIELSEDDLKSKIKEILGEIISERFDFSCKLGWNTFDYDILAEIDIPLDEKKRIITEEFMNLLKKGAAGVEGFENIPKDFRKYLPFLGKSIYLDGKKTFEDSEVQKAYDNILEEQGPQKTKLHFIAYFLETYPEHEPFLNNLKKEIESSFEKDLKPNSDAIKTIVDSFFGDEGSKKAPSKENMCFLCGRESETKYQKGHEAFYSTQSYSRRTKPRKKYKHICEVCNLEYALLADICEKDEINLRNDVEVAYFYYDDFIGDIRLHEERSASIIQGDTTVMDEPDPSIDLISPQYHLQPFYVVNKNHRMSIIRECIETIQESGMKVVIGKPFSRFRTSSYVFEDEEPIRKEESLSIDKINRFEDLNRPLELFDIMSSFSTTDNPYLELDRDDFHNIADFAVVSDFNHQQSKLVDYLKTYHGESMLEMKKIAENGMELFGKQYESKYKKTKIFRECLDSFLSGMSQGMKDEVLIEHVAGQIYDAAKREDYAGHVDYEDTIDFVKSVKNYLEENELYNLKRMSDWENALINSYLFAYDQLLYGDKDEN